MAGRTWTRWRGHDRTRGTGGASAHLVSATGCERQAPCTACSSCWCQLQSPPKVLLRFGVGGGLSQSPPKVLLALEGVYRKDPLYATLWALEGVYRKDPLYATLGVGGGLSQRPPLRHWASERGGLIDRHCLRSEGGGGQGSGGGGGAGEGGVIYRQSHLMRSGALPPNPRPCGGLFFCAPAAG